MSRPGQSWRLFCWGEKWPNSVNDRRPPVVDIGTLSPAELEAVRSDFWEMIGWWRDRRLKQVHASMPRDTARQTYHVERRYLNRIKEEAEAEGMSITEVVNLYKISALFTLFLKRNFLIK